EDLHVPKPIPEFLPLATDCYWIDKAEEILYKTRNRVAAREFFFPVSFLSLRTWEGPHFPLTLRL
ncbi:MAG: hypothetical protein WAR22_14755, partial [Desulfomonilia bacterium]